MSTVSADLGFTALPQTHHFTMDQFFQPLNEEVKMTFLPKVLLILWIWLWMMTSTDRSQTKQKYCIVHRQLHSTQKSRNVIALCTATIQTFPSCRTAPHTEVLLSSCSETRCSPEASLRRRLICVSKRSNNLSYLIIFLYIHPSLPFLVLNK